MDYTFRCRAYPDDEAASEGWRHIDIHRQIRNESVCEYYRALYDDRPSETDQVNRFLNGNGAGRFSRRCRHTPPNRPFDKSTTI